MILLATTMDKLFSTGAAVAVVVITAAAAEE